jgi:hypothetical protein
MRQYTYGVIGFLAIAGLVATGVPASVQAQDAATTGAVQAQRAGDQNALTPEVRAQMELKAREEVKMRMEANMRAELKAREEMKMRAEAMSSEEKTMAREEMKEKLEAREGDGVSVRADLGLRLENANVRAMSVQDLREKLEVRRAELMREEASTTPRFRAVVKNANDVRLAVHTLLSSRDLLGGGIGSEVSLIAQRMNDAVASTTNAEAQIESRGFFQRVLFGGDRAAAEALRERAVDNRADIERLRTLLANQDISVDVAAELSAQAEVLENAQERLDALANSERRRWGIFSWRLFGGADTAETTE